jgi:hypothetical protein
VGVSFAPSRRTTFAVNQTVTYQPFNLYGLVPQPEPPGLGESNTPAVDFYLTNQGYASYSTSANFKRQLSRRATLSADYGFHFSDMPSVLGAYSSQTGSIRFTQSLTKGLGVHLGYGYTVASYSREDGDFGYHNIDAGVDYSNTLSFSRKTTLSFSTGTSFAPTNGNVGFHVTGSASLNHEIGRTWELTAGYNRYVGFFDFYAGLVEYQSATANLSGLLSRRLSFYTGLTATSGVLGADASGYGFGDLHSSTGLNVALNRYLSLNANYSLHRYSRADAVPVPDWIAADMLRQTVSVSISAQAPLFQRGRSRNASR